MKRIASLDLIRGIAAFSVAISHYFILCSIRADVFEVISVLGVEVFFVLSGYVLASQIMASVRSNSWANMRIFLIRRWMRTIPPYIFALLAISFLVNSIFSSDFFRYAVYVQNLIFPANTNDYYPVAWSLSVEEWFYVTFPLLLFVCMKDRLTGTIQQFVFASLVLVTIVAIVRLVFGGGVNWGLTVRRVVVFRIDAIIYGFLLFIATTRIGRADRVKLSINILALVCAVFFGVIAFIGVSCIAQEKSHISQILFPFYAAAFGCSTIFLFCTLSQMVEKSKILSVLSSYLGKLSYSVYLFHIIIAGLLRQHIQHVPIVIQVVIYISVVVLFCICFYFYFERPILASRPAYLPSLSYPEDNWIKR